MSKELAVIHNVTAEVFNKPESVQELLKKIEVIANDFKGDLSTEEGRKEIDTLAKKINRSKTAVDDMGKEEVAKLKELPKQIDAQRKIFRDKMDEFKTKVRTPLTEWELAEDSRKALHDNNITLIIERGNEIQTDWQNESLDVMFRNILSFEDKKNNDWEEFSERADQVINEAIEKIEKAIEKRKAYDLEQKELEELRALKSEQEKAEAERLAKEQKAKLEAERVEREKKIAVVARMQAEKELAEAKQKAIDDAKKAEEARVLAEKRAIEEKAEAEARAKLEAEQAVKREQERVAQEKLAAEEEARKIEAEIKAREEDKQYRKSIEQSVFDDIKKNHKWADRDILSLINSITKGKINNLKIIY